MQQFIWTYLILETYNWTIGSVLYNIIVIMHLLKQKIIQAAYGIKYFDCIIINERVTTVLCIQLSNKQSL